MCKVSILIPVYNAEKYLAEAIDSIISQTFTDWELIIINDGSDDASDSIIQSYDDTRIRYFVNEQNLGLIKTLNKGVALCKGTYIARMDADDISLPYRLEKQVAFMTLNPDIVLCGTNASVIGSDGMERGKVINPSDNATLQISLLFTNPFVHPSIMARRDMLIEESFDEKWVHVEDFELWTRLAGRGKIANVAEALIQYRWHESNVSNVYSLVQESAKNEIVTIQLAQLDIYPTERELELHRYTFMLYSLGTKNSVEQSTFDDVGDWFGKLSSQNRKLKKYPIHNFDAYLWSRWIVLCVTQNRKSKIVFPGFLPFSLATLCKTMKLVIYLSKK